MRTTHEHSESKVLAVAVVLSIVLGLVAGTMIADAPPAAATGEEVLAWYRASGDHVRWSLWMLTVGIPPGAYMFARLGRLLPASHRDVYLLGAIGVLVTPLIPAMVMGGLALHAGQLQAATARTVHDLSLFFGPMLTGFTVTMMAPVTLLALGRGGLVPKWIGLLGAISILEQAVETITIFGTTGFTEPGGAMNLRLGAGLVSAWMLAFGLWGALKGVAAAGDSSRC